MSDGDPFDPKRSATFEEIIRARFGCGPDALLGRRAFLRGLSSLGPWIALGSLPGIAESGGGSTGDPTTSSIEPKGRQHRRPLTFTPITPGSEDGLRVPEGYRWTSLAKWGDPVQGDTPAFDPDHLTAAHQAAQFGYNCDFLAFFPLSHREDPTPRLGAIQPTPGSDEQAPTRQTSNGETDSDDAPLLTHGLLAINHEYTNPKLMFASYEADQPTAETVAIELAAHGLSIVQVRRGENGDWFVVSGSRNRRYSAFSPMELAGPAAGHEWLRTSADPSGRKVWGTLNNCGGGKTPWGTLLTCEENFDDYFGRRGQMGADDPRRAVHERYGIESEAVRWELQSTRFDVSTEPNEPFRFGWVVEIDPYDPTFVPRKRTALGRYKHETATVSLAANNQVVVYSADDEAYEHLYKFVTTGRFDPAAPEASRDLLDEGTLYVARFGADGSGEWLPLVHGEGSLRAENGFANQGHVLIKARLAATQVGATPLDRPEGIAIDPVTGALYVALTNNTDRDTTDAVNPRSGNQHGHILEIREDDRTGRAFRWEILLLAGDPRNTAADGSHFCPCPTEQQVPLSCPDMLIFDPGANLWVATDGQEKFGRPDGLFAITVDGPDRGHVRPFASLPPGAECTGPEFTPDGRALFLAVQHPGDGGTYDEPRSRFPDGEGPPRPTVVCIVRKDGNVIGT